MNTIKGYVSHFPLESNFYKGASVGLACISIGALYYGSPLTAALSAFGAIAAFGIQQVKKTLEKMEAGKALCQKLFSSVKDLINFQGNQYSTETKTEMLKVLGELQMDNLYIREGGDLRAPIVGLQQIFEHAIKNLIVSDRLKFQGVIHTPLPATPLCTQVDQADLSNVMAPSLLSDPDKTLTVKNRALTVRELLTLPDTRLYVVYSKGGLEERDIDSQQVFKSEINKNPNTLIGIELSGKINPDRVGATYILITPNGGTCAFCIDAQQANQEIVEKWGIYCGSLDDETIKKRVNLTFDDIMQRGKPDVKEKIKAETGLDMS